MPSSHNSATNSDNTTGSTARSITLELTPSTTSFSASMPNYLRHRHPNRQTSVSTHSRCLRSMYSWHKSVSDCYVEVSCRILTKVIYFFFLFNRMRRRSIICFLLTVFAVVRQLLFYVNAAVELLRSYFRTVTFVFNVDARG